MQSTWRLESMRLSFYQVWDDTNQNRMSFMENYQVTNIKTFGLNLTLPLIAYDINFNALFLSLKMTA